MRKITICEVCKSKDVEYLGNDKWHCNKCKKEVNVCSEVVHDYYERARATVYATGNRWAIENWNATH